MFGGKPVHWTLFLSACTPIEVRRLADPSLPTNLGNRCAFFALLDDGRLLRVREFGCLHRYPILSQPRGSQRKTLSIDEDAFTDHGRAYQARVEKLEREKLLLAERADTIIPPTRCLDEVIEHAMAFPASPWDIYEKGSYSLKRTVLKPAFVEPLWYSRLEGYRTAETAFPFTVLAEANFKKVRFGGA